MNNDIILRLNSLLANITSILVVVIISYVITNITIQYFTPAKTTTITAINTPVTNTNKLNLLLFGETALLPPPALTPPPSPPTPPPPPPQPVVQPIPKVIHNLNLKLSGIIKTYPLDKSLAIISNNGGVDKIYSLNAMIDGNTKLMAIRENFISVLHYGEKKSVYVFSKPTAKYVYSKPIAKVAIKPINTPATISPSISNNSTNISVNLPESFAPKFKLIRQKLSTNPIALMNLFAGMPVIRNSKMYGIRISPGSDKALFKALQLEPQDIIISVNNIPLSDPGKLSQLIDLIDNTTVFNIDLERAGTKRNLTVALPP